MKVILAHQVRLEGRFREELFGAELTRVALVCSVCSLVQFLMRLRLERLLTHRTREPPLLRVTQHVRLQRPDDLERFVAKVTGEVALV